MIFYINLNKIGGKLRKLWTLEYFIIGGMGENFKSHFLKVVFLINLVYFGGTDCLSLE